MPDEHSEREGRLGQWLRPPLSSSQSWLAAIGAWTVVPLSTILRGTDVPHPRQPYASY
jgi:hypothetical protein